MECTTRAECENKVGEIGVDLERLEEEGVDKNDAMVGDSLGKEKKRYEENENSELHESEYSFSSQQEEVDVDNVAMPRPDTKPHGGIRGVGGQV